jgi:hypothetical protein
MTLKVDPADVSETLVSIIRKYEASQTDDRNIGHLRRNSLL